MFDPGEWAVWHYRATITNDGANSGNHVYNFSPGGGNMMILLGANLHNGDLSARNAQALLRDNDNNPIRRPLFLGSVAAGAERQIPTSELSSDDGSASDPPGEVIAGWEDLNVSVDSLAVNENTDLAIQFLISAAPPTVTLTSPTGATESETENRVV